MPNFGDEDRFLAFPISTEVTGPQVPPVSGFPPVPDFNETNRSTSQPAKYYNSGVTIEPVDRELNKIYGDDQSPYKKYNYSEDIIVYQNGVNIVVGKISNVNVTLHKPTEWEPGVEDPRNNIVVSFDVSDPDYQSDISIYISFSTNQEVHPEKTSPLHWDKAAHIYSEHYIDPAVFYENPSDSLKVYFHATNGTVVHDLPVC